MEPRNVIVTGASYGIGQYIARALAARQVNLLLVARSEQKPPRSVVRKLSLFTGVDPEAIVFDRARRRVQAGDRIADHDRQVGS